MTITAKFTSRCPVCGGQIQPGDRVEWQRGEKARHLKCEKPVYNFPTFAIGGGSGSGCNGWAKGQIIRNSPRSIERGEPEFLYVLESSQRYFRVDGWSFGVGDDQGYLYDGLCREATEEEAAPLKAKIQKREEIKAAKAELLKIKDQIRNNGVKPDGKNTPEGERVLDTQTIYGGGDWFVVGTELVWYVQNNGGDGDAWDWNNVRTGGAGAIGWYIPRTETLVTELDRLADLLEEK
jgi:hypothetical protein